MDGEGCWYYERPESREANGKYGIDITIKYVVILTNF